MKIRTKMYLVITIATMVLATLLIASGLYFFGLYSRATEREHGLMAAELVRTELMMRLMDGTFDEQDLLPDLAHVIPALHSVRIARSEAVMQQYGGEQDGPQSEPEERALATGSPVEMLVETDQGVFFRYIAPYTAENSNGRNCLACHDVPLGTVLGVVALELDLTRQRSATMNYTGAIVGLLVLFAFPLAYFLRRLLLPIADATLDIHAVVSKAEQGDFSGRLEQRSSDEISQISEQTNRLMTTLEESFGTIVKDVEALSGRRHQKNDRNLLTHTVATVRNMVDAVRFRQTVESDRNLEEVYERIRFVLIGNFGLDKFSLYEVDSERDHLKILFAEGLPEGESLWCDEEILTDGTACRARRTAQEVDSFAEAGICGAFAGHGEDPGHRSCHVCIPLLLGGSVSAVLQILYSAGEAPDIQEKLHSIKTYIDEAAPVIESKRLTDILRESTLRDPMTGLYNRRFLEQFSDRLTSTTDRQESSLSLLMCDLDSFKEMNDTHGHEAGDLALHEAVRIFGASVRHTDFVIRMGGDEFLVILADSSPEKATEVAERIRASMEANRFDIASRKLKMTLSLGVSIYPQDSEDFQECMRAADAALYCAKEAGCNRALRFRPNMLRKQP
ncbi:MAG: diguanylate cyclase [Acidobacteriota bacterium]|jgi:diguanylate cyclase (GGDEF)-like protein|nr:diguanylate cyclase [Acidobacteriota bacterium]